MMRAKRPALAAVGGCFRVIKGRGAEGVPAAAAPPPPAEAPASLPTTMGSFDEEEEDGDCDVVPQDGVTLVMNADSFDTSGFGFAGLEDEGALCMKAASFDTG